MGVAGASFLSEECPTEGAWVLMGRGLKKSWDEWGRACPYAPLLGETLVPPDTF